MKKLIYILFSILIISMLFATGAYAKKNLYAAVDGMLEMYLSPDKDSLKITDIPGSAELNLIKSDGTWGNVVFANKCGWINMSFTRDSYEEAAEATGYETLKNVQTNSKENGVDLYTLPSSETKYGSEKKYSVPDGVILKISRETSDGWGLVCIKNEYLWVNLRDTKPYITETEQAIEDYELYYIYTFSEDGKGVKLYSEPKKASVLTTISDCVKLTVRKTQNNYAYVSYNGINGWVNLDNVTKSLSSARANTGKEVNAEYKITGEPSFSVDIFNVPSNKIKDGAVAVGSVKAGTEIFVQRCTGDGWMLVNHNGNIGWIPPDNATVQPNDDTLLIEPLEKKRYGYVSTDKKSGLVVYSGYDSNTAIARIPECVKVEVLAEKDGRQYVYCDYAAGWTADGLADSYEKALNADFLENSTKYTIGKNAVMMKLPMEDLLCGNETLITLEKGTEVKILRIVTSGNTKWGLTEINGKKGWVTLDKTKRVYSPLEITLYIISVLFGALTILVVTLFVIRKMVKIRKKEQSEDFGENEIKQNI